MLIALCTLLAASPVSGAVSASLLPQSSSFHLLEEHAADAVDGESAKELKGRRIAAEAVGGALLGVGLGLAGFFGSNAALGGGWSNLTAEVLITFAGLELGEIAGVSLAGIGMAGRGSVWAVVLGNLAGVVAGFLLGMIPVVGLIGLLALPLVGEIVLFEALVDGPPPAAPPPGRTSPENQGPTPPPLIPAPGDVAALTIRF